MYIELKCKSNFSFLEGASDSRDYLASAFLLGMPAVGISDVNGVYALPRAFEAKKRNELPVKIIHGAEIRVEDGHPPITLIAKDRVGWGLLCRILTAVHAGKEKGEGFITFGELLILKEHFLGMDQIFCLVESTPLTNFHLLKSLFDQNLYIMLCRYLDGMDEERTEIALKASRRFELPIVATNDVHYHVQDRRPLQDCLTCVREGTNIDEAGFKIFGNAERYLKSPLQMQAIFQDLPEAIENTVRIANACTFSLSELKYSYPQEFIPEGYTAKSYLEKLVLEGASRTYKGGIPLKVDSQIRRELQFFAERDLEHYFLTVFDYVDWARRNNIICQGRGSAANSVVCYLLGITSVDPIHMNLLFDRFMNAGRNEPPDIDVDFEHDRREEVIQYIYSRFGRERAAMVSAVRTYQDKSSYHELAKALGVDVGTVSAGELKDRFEELAGEKKYRGVLLQQLMQELKGFPRHLSIHSGGFVLSNDPLVEICPIEPARMPGRTIVQWDKDDLAALGLMKVDVLSIGFLTALHKSCDLANIDWRDIPEDDPKTYAMIRRAETHGTFQIESRAQMNMLVQTLPTCYYDLVVEVALVRPSPSKGGMIAPYLAGRAAQRRGQKFKVGNEKLERILERTCGVPIFQEQIMEISIEVADYSPAEADHLRRSLGKARSAEGVDETGTRLKEALINCGVRRDFAEKLFDYIKGYAHYGFPESHAASYASLAYKSSYMKAHHPAELLIGLINSQPMGFYPIDTLINEAKRNGVRVLPIHPNISIWESTLEAPNTVRMGFMNVAKLNEETVTELIKEKEKRSFTSIEDFITRTQFSRDVLENLAMANVFQCFRVERRHAFWHSIEFSNLLGKDSKEQLSLFDEKLKTKAQLGLFDHMNLLDEQMLDYRKTGYSLEGNVMRGLRIEMPHIPSLTSVQAHRAPNGAKICFAGILTVLQRPPPANGTAFITLEDEFGSVDTVLKNDTYEKYMSVIRGSRFLIFDGEVQRKGTGMSILVTHVESFNAASSGRPNAPNASPRTIGPLDFEKLGILDDKPKQIHLPLPKPKEGYQGSQR